MAYPKRSFVAIAFALCLALLACAQTQPAPPAARIHYVIPGQPLDVEAVGPGDTVVLRDGTYPSMPPVVSGAPGAPVTYRAENARRAVIDSTGKGESPGLHHEELSGTGLLLDGHSHLRIQGFLFRNCRQAIVIRGGSEDVEFEDIEITGARMGVRIGDASHFAFRRNHWHRNFRGGVYLDGGGARDGLFEDVVSEFNDDGRGRAGDSDGFQMRPEVRRITFRRCVARGNGEDGFDLKGRDILVEDCVAAENGARGFMSWNTGTRIVNSLAYGNTRGFVFGNFYPQRESGARAKVALLHSTSAANRNENLSVGAAVDMEMRGNVIAAGETGVAFTHAQRLPVDGPPSTLRLSLFLPELNPGVERPAELQALNLFWAPDPRYLAWVAPGRTRLTPEQLAGMEWDVENDGVEIAVAAPMFRAPEGKDYRPAPEGKAAREGLGAPEGTFALDTATRQ